MNSNLDQEAATQGFDTKDDNNRGFPKKDVYWGITSHGESRTYVQNTLSSRKT